MQRTPHKRISSGGSGQSGFTLIELLISVAVFTMVMVGAMSALLTIVNLSRKAHSLDSVMNNLNFAVDEISRTMRVGSNYQCIGQVSGGNGTDCTGGGTGLTFQDQNNAVVTYQAVQHDADHPSLYEITKTTGGVTQAITAPEIYIQSLKFYVFGTTAYPDLNQPRALIVLQGYAGDNPGTRSYFKIQTTVSQRILDH